MKTINTKALTAFTLLFICCANNASAQNIFPANGRAGIYTTAPATSLQVRGGARIGTTANYVSIDSATGNLSFNGTSAYRVAGNKYAFQYSGNPNYGLYFNSTNVQYEFRNGSAVPVFYINANNGNGVFTGNLKIGAYTLPATDGTIGQSLKTDGAGNISWATVSGGGGANTALSNLAATAVNVSLLPGTDSARDMGSALLSWKNIYLKGGLYFNGVKMMQYRPGVNTIIGEGAGSTGAGGFNTALGTNVLCVNTTGNANVAIGEYSLQNNTTGTNNTATGYAALINNNEGFNNVATGFEALYSNTTGHYNTGNGKNALYYNTTGSYNTAIGVSSLEKNNADENTAIGAYALQENTIGNQNTATGAYALTQNTEGVQNTATGMNALGFNTTGSYNTANGCSALYSNETGTYNTAIGGFTLQANTTGSGNTANGYQALQYNTTGGDNTAVGELALWRNITGGSNVAIGGEALLANTTGSWNTAIGSGSLSGNTNENDNTAIGHTALNSNEGSNNTAVGADAMRLSTNGNQNSALGVEALFNNYDGNNNTAFGYKALWTNYLGSWNTCIGDRADVSATNFNGASSFGTQAITNADNKIVIGASGVATMVIGGYKPWSNLSDGRFKEQVKENVPGLAFIKKLRPVTYTVNVDKLQHHITAQMPDSIARHYYPDANAIASAKKYIQTGFIAQEVEKTAKEINYQFDGVNAPQNPTDNYSIAYSQFVPSLVKAVQELSNENEEQKRINTELQNQIDELKLLIQSGNQQSININQSGAVLEQNIPNPFNQSTIINYTLPAKFNSAKIIVTDNNGKAIKQFILSSSVKGSVSIAANLLAGGLYHYALYVDGKMVDSKKMEIIR